MNHYDALTSRHFLTFARQSAALPLLPEEQRDANEVVEAFARADTLARQARQRWRAETAEPVKNHRKLTSSDAAESTFSKSRVDEYLDPLQADEVLWRVDLAARA